MTATWKRFAAATILCAAVALAQAPAEVTPAPTELKPQFFAGTVTALDHEHITVSRTSAGKPPVNRSFVIKATTKLNKSLKVSSKVTVRYEHQDNDDVALEVQLSAVRRPVKPS